MAEPWERQPKETERAHAAFRVFLGLGTARTLVDAYRQARGKKGARQASGEWNDWAYRFDWDARARAWDNYLQAERDREKAAAAAAEEREWQERTATLRRDLWDRAYRLIAQSDLMARFPIAERTVDEKDADGRPLKVTLKPARWTFATMVRSYGKAFELAEHAVALPAVLAALRAGTPGGTEAPAVFGAIADLLNAAQDADPDDDGSDGSDDPDAPAGPGPPA